MLAYKDDYKKINQSCVSKIDCKKTCINKEKEKKNDVCPNLYEFNQIPSV